MKRIYSQPYHRERSKRQLRAEMHKRGKGNPGRQTRRERQHLSSALASRGTWRASVRGRPSRGYHIKVPGDFSFINNPVEMLQFVRDLKTLASRSSLIQVDLSEIKSMTPDGIAFFLKSIYDLKVTDVIGNEPEDPVMQAMLQSSGFYQHVKSVTSQRKTEQAKGAIRRHTSHMVETDVADELSAFAANRLYGEYRKLGGVYRALIECMSNTKDHATREKRPTVPWWTMVYFDETQKRAHFTFIDTGLGIFKSVKFQGIVQKATTYFSSRTRTQVIWEILDGTIGSRTGLSYRGKGLPGILAAYNMGDIENLILVTNDVFCDVARKDSHVLTPHFTGTFLHWEVSARDGNVDADQAAQV